MLFGLSWIAKALFGMAKVLFGVAKVPLRGESSGSIGDWLMVTTILGDGWMVGILGIGR